MANKPPRGRVEPDSRGSDHQELVARDVLDAFQSYASTWGNRVADKLSPEQTQEMMAKMDDILSNTPIADLPEPLREMLEVLDLNPGTECNVKAIRNRMVEATQASLGGDFPIRQKYDYARLDLKGEACPTSNELEYFVKDLDCGLVYYKDGGREWNSTFKFWACEEHELENCEKCGKNSPNSKKVNQLLKDLVKDRCLTRGKATWVDTYMPDFMAWSIQIMTDRAFGQNDELCNALAAIVPSGTDLVVVKSIAMLIEVTSFIFDPEHPDELDSPYYMFMRHLATGQRRRPGFKVMTLELFRQIFETFDERHIFRIPEMVVAMFEMEIPRYVPDPGCSAIGTLVPFITHYFNVPPGQPDFEFALSNAIMDAEEIVIPLKQAPIPKQAPATPTNAQPPAAKQERRSNVVYAQFDDFVTVFPMNDTVLFEKLWIVFRKKLVEAGRFHPDEHDEDWALVPALDCPDVRTMWQVDCRFPHYIPLQCSLSAFDLNEQKSEVRLAVVEREYVEIGIFVHGPGARTEDYFAIRTCITNTFRDLFDEYWDDFEDEFGMVGRTDTYGFEFLRDGTPGESMNNQHHSLTTTPTPWLSKLKFNTGARRRLLPDPGTVFELGSTLYSHNLLHGVHIGLRKL